ncbi:MAG: RDD family protein [Bacteroidales bacterium]|nr:RDD family protein [Bacteroidales bacterium]
MQKLQVETAQNVVIEQEVANVGERIAAFLLDGIILASYFFFIFLIIGAFSNNGNNGGSLVVFFFLIPVFFYALLCETFMNGQSFGKMALKIKVAKLDGSQPTFGNYLVRWLFRIIDNSFYGIPAIITIVVNGKGQRIGDIVAKTSVISLKRSKSINETMFEETSDDYSVVYPESEFLQDSDINTVKDVLVHYKKDPTNAISVSMLRQAVDAVKKKTGIETSQTPGEFLKTIITDYNHIHKS